MKNKKLKKVKSFLKNAFCIDGDIEYLGEKQMVGDDHLWGIFELTDSKRGKFKIAMKGSGKDGSQEL